MNIGNILISYYISFIAIFHNFGFISFQAEKKDPKYWCIIVPN